MARFIRLGEHPVLVKMYAEIIGADSLEIREGLKSGRVSWPEWDPFDSRPRPDGKGVFDPALHLYLSGKTNDMLNTVSLDRKRVEEFVLSAASGKIAPDSYFYKLQFRRKIDAQVVCFRTSDEKPVVNGFGEENSRGRKCDSLHSELYVDRRPGIVFTKYNGSEKVGEEVWEDFKPVYLKIKPALKKITDAMLDASDSGDTGQTIELARLSDKQEFVQEADYYLKVWTEWNYDEKLDEGEILVMSEKNPSDVPQELLDYKFPWHSQSKPNQFEQDAISQFRRRVR